MLVALLVANLVDAPGISWINYAILVYDIISAAIVRFAGLTKRSQKDSSNSFNKRELIMQGNVSNELLFSSNTYWRIMHTNFNSWKSKIEETYNPFIV